MGRGRRGIVCPNPPGDRRENEDGVEPDEGHRLVPGPSRTRGGGDLEGASGLGAFQQRRHYRKPARLAGLGTRGQVSLPGQPGDEAPRGDGVPVPVGILMDRIPESSGAVHVPGPRHVRCSRALLITYKARPAISSRGKSGHGSSESPSFPRKRASRGFD